MLASRSACHRALSIRELVSHIFLTADSIPDLHQAPLNVSQTCREWRHIALNLSGLWSYITLDVNVAKQRERDYLKLLGIWLQRSGERPLDISMNLFWTVPDTFAEFTNQYVITAQLYAAEMVRLLSAYQSRWRNVQLVSSGPSFPDWFSIMLSNMPLLTTLSIGFKWLDGLHAPGHFLIGRTNSYTQPRATYILDVTRQPTLPALRNLELFFIADHGVSPAMTSLSTMLQATPNLQKLTVWFEDNRDIPDVNSITQTINAGFRIPLSHLRELSWKVKIGKFSEMLRLCLRAPALKSIWLEIQDDECAAYANWLRDQSPEGVSSIRTLMLDLSSVSDRFDPANVVILLSAMPAMKSLAVGLPSSENAWQRGFWRQLSWNNDAQAVQLCPRLNLLDLRIGNCADPVNQPFLVDIMKMIRSRLRRGRFGAVVRLGWPCDEPPPVWEPSKIMENMRDTVNSLGLKAASVQMEEGEGYVELTFLSKGMVLRNAVAS
ncbi:hypothetical protein BC629DRAFT_1528260 [Irpex lacteus]|nr:hypothetical protein BC629DRAFT_1528260 [Irpex lacteus]